MVPDERRRAILAMARWHREETAGQGREMMHVIHASRGERDVAMLFGWDIKPLMAVAEVIITAAHADSAILITDTRGRMAPERKLNPLTGKPLPGEMTDAEVQAYVEINPFTGKHWQPGEMQALADKGLAKQAGLRDFLIVMYFTRPNVPEAGRPFQWALSYEVVRNKVAWGREEDQGEASMGGWIYRAFMRAFRSPDLLEQILAHPIGAELGKHMSPEKQQAHLDAAALKYGLARVKPGTVIGMVPMYEEDHPDRIAALQSSLEPEQLQKDVSYWSRLLRAEAN